MKSDDDMQRVMEQIFFNSYTPSDKFSDLLVPCSNQTKDFFKNTNIVLTAATVFANVRWRNFFYKSYINALSKKEMYFRYVMFVSEIEASFHDNIFDKIINVFALVKEFNTETMKTCGVNFIPFSVNIFMEFFKCNLEDSFYKKGGFEQFSEYIRCHEYLPFEHYMLDFDMCKTEKRVPVLKNWRIKVDEKNMKSYPNFVKHSDVIENTRSERLAKRLLLSTKINLPILPNSDYLHARLQALFEVSRAILKTSAGQPTSTNSEDQRIAEFVKCETRTEYSSGETIAAFSNRDLTVAPTKRETLTASSNHETIAPVSEARIMTNSSKFKTTATTTNSESTAASANREKLTAFSNHKTTENLMMMAEIKKCETSESSKLKTMAESTKCETAIPSLRRETFTPASSRLEALTASSNRERDDITSIQKIPKAVFKPETTAQKTSDEAFKPETIKQKAPESYWKPMTEESAKCEKTETVLQRFAILESDSQMSNAVEQKKHLDWCEDIFRKVVKYNNSKLSNTINANNEIQEIDKLLMHLKDRIKSLIDIL